LTVVRSRKAGRYRIIHPFLGASSQQQTLLDLDDALFEVVEVELGGAGGVASCPP